MSTTNSKNEPNIELKNTSQLLSESIINAKKENSFVPKYISKKRLSYKIKKVKRISCHNKFLINPSITHFNAGSNFIYDLDSINEYFSRTSNKNLIKLNDKEIIEIKKVIQELKYEKSLDRKQEIIYIDKSLSDDLTLYFSDRKYNNNPLKEFLLDEIKSSDRNNFSVRKLSRKYEEITGKKASKSTIHNCLRNQLGLKYLKTTIKTDKILNKENILISFAFIKIIARCIKLKFNIIYCDETSLQNSNNNYYCWRKSDESIFSNLGPKKRKNLIMAVNNDSVLYYQINDESTNEETFYIFMQKLGEIILEKKISPYVIVLDNLSCHKTKKLIELYSSKKINIIFNTPYLSSFNSIELCFRNIKRLLYTKIYNSIEELIDEVIEYIKEKNFIDGLKSNFSQTLEKYLLFYENYSSLNLNNI